MTTKIVFTDSTSVVVGLDAKSVRNLLARSRKRREMLTPLAADSGSTIYVAGDKVAYLETVAVSRYGEALVS